MGVVGWPGTGAAGVFPRPLEQMANKVISRITLTALPMQVKATAPRCSSCLIQPTFPNFAHAFQAYQLF